jgi:hypothetical protein
MNELLSGMFNTVFPAKLPSQVARVAPPGHLPASGLRQA